MKSVTVQAPAKVNYRLDVLRKRPDGYHDLRMIMQLVDLCDQVTVTVSEGEGISVVSAGGEVPEGPGNIAWKAASVFREATGMRAKVSVEIVKRIPVAAGLGGGSSDGAAVLTALDKLLGTGMGKERLMELGVKLGADVPFFIFGRTALAEGIGEILTPIDEIAPAWIVLVNPGVHVSTAWAYGNLKLTPGRGVATIPRFFGSVSEIAAILSNDLETVTVPEFPVVAEIRELLKEKGAVGAMMSGSGPTVFGIFEDGEAAAACAGALGKGTGWFTAAVRTR